MSDSTTNLDLISSGQAQKEVTANSLFDAASPAMLFGRRASTSAALTWGYYGGVIRIGSTLTAIPNGTVVLSASATNYIEVDPATGTVSVNTSAFTAGRMPLYAVVAGASTVSSYTDQRTLASMAGGLSDGDKGDVIVSGSGSTFTIDSAVLSGFGRTLTAAADNAAARTLLGVGVGTDVQAYDAELSAIAGLTSAANKGIQFTGAGTAATFDLTAAGKALIDDADAAAQRATLGLGTVATLASDTDTTLSANSDTRVATQKATKAYVDSVVTGGAADVMIFKGVIDCSANPNYPAADAGNLYKVSVPGKIGGASGPNVEAGDTLYCIADSTASGNHTAVGAGWVIAQANLDGAVIGPASATDSHFMQFDGTSGKLAKGGIALDTDATLAANSNTKLPSQAAVKSYVDGKVAGLSWKQAVRAATTAAGTLASSFKNGDAIDGVTLATGDRILIKNQASGSENGIHTVNASGAPTRSTDADSGAELVNATVYVSEGTTNADTQWTCSTNAPITVGSTSLTFAQLTSGGGGGLTNWTDAFTSGSPYNYASLTATNAATNVAAVIVPKGNGQFMLSIPDSTSTGGNARGSSAVDLQLTRTAASQVAAGGYSVIGGGQNNTANGGACVVPGGNSNTASGTASFAMGASSTASGTGSFAMGDGSMVASGASSFAGGYNNTASANYATAFGIQNTASGVNSFATGFGSNTRGLIGARSHTGQRFSSAGDGQEIKVVVRSETTDATPKVMSANGSAATTDNQLVLQNNSSMTVKGIVVARKLTTGDTKSWSFEASIKRGANAAATAMVAACTPTVVAADSGASAWTLAVAADTTNGALALTFTGVASTFVRGVASLTAVELVL
jgi:hypothetical protein